MPLGQKLKRAFGSKKNGSGESSSSGESTPQRTDIEYYKPHEIPKSKYKGKPDKEVQEKFEAYSFSNAFQSVRRKSSQALSGTLSPGGTQSQSRRASWMSRTHSALSVASTTSDADNSNVRRKSVAAAGAPKEADLVEKNEEDSPTTTSQGDGATLNLEKTVTAARPPSSNNIAFTAQDLEQAMTQASLRRRRGTAVAVPEIVQPQGITA